MSQQIVISKAKKSEALEMAKELKDFFSEESLSVMGKDFDKYADYLYGAYLDGEMVGFVSLRKADSLILEILWMGVIPSLHRKGVGSALITSVLAVAELRDFKICYVKTLAETVDNEAYTRTRLFYRSLGFNTLEIIDPYPGWNAGNPCQIMAAILPLFH